MSETLVLPELIGCGGCGHPVPPRLTVCPSCHALVHRVKLEQLAAAAAEAERTGAWDQAGRLGRNALPLLPRGSKQYDGVAARIEAATPHLGEEPGAKPRSGWGKLLAPLGLVGAAAWKLKFLL